MNEDKILAREIMPDIISFEPIKDGESGSRVYRIKVREGRSFVLKITFPEDIPDYLTKQYPCIAETEYYFYQEIFPRLELPAPQIFERGLLPGGGNFLFFSDITENYSIPINTGYLEKNQWEKILTSYAHVHSFCKRYFRDKGVPIWVNPPLVKKYCPGKTISTWEKLAQNPLTSQHAKRVAKDKGLEKLAWLVEEKIQEFESILIHNDFYPGNLGLPLDKGEKAAILDWQLASTGPGAIDLALMDLDWNDYWLDFYLKKTLVSGEKTTTLNSFREELFFSRLLNDGVFLPVILDAARKEQKEGKKLSSWMEGCLEKSTQNWKNALRKN